LFHNARPFSARQTRDLLTKFRWEIFGHSAYSPVLFLSVEFKWFLSAGNR